MEKEKVVPSIATDDPLPSLHSIFEAPWHVHIGAYNNPVNAINMLQEAHEKGFDQAYIEDATGKVVMY